MSDAKTKSEMLDGIPIGYLSAKMAGRSTIKVTYPDGTQLLKYHDTVVIKKNPDGSVVLNSGGFRTITTKKRINEYFTGSSYGPLTQENGIWYIYGQMFYDGIIVKDEKVISEERKLDLKHINLMKKKIAKYVKLIEDGEIPTPNNGDCLICRIPDTKDTNHLLSHLKENYVVGSLLVNAMRENGYDDERIRTHYGMGFTDSFANSVRRYLTKRLLPGVAAK
jgi:hypothetical protein